MNKVEENNLIKTIDDLAKDKAEKTKLEGAIKKASDFVKKKFNELEIEEYTTDNFRAYLQYSNKIDMDEDKIIQILKENCKKDDYEKVIRTKEYVDFEALESLIYNGGIPAEKLEPAQTTKTTISLYTKPVKKEKEDE
jgi:hypothetical protein